MDYQAIFDFGTDAAYEYVNNGNFAGIRKILADANAPDANRRQVGTIASLGVFMALANVLDGVKQAGVRFSNPVPTAAEFSYERMRGSKAYSAIAQRLVDSVAALRRDGPGFKVCRSTPTQDAATPGRSTEIPAPVRVEVISMPARKTTSIIERNPAGEIAATTQIEKDIASC